MTSQDLSWRQLPFVYPTTLDVCIPWYEATLGLCSSQHGLWPRILAPPFPVPAHEEPITLAGPLAVCKNCPSTLQLSGNFHLFLELTRTFCILVTIILVYATWNPVGTSGNSGAQMIDPIPLQSGRWAHHFPGSRWESMRPTSEGKMHTCSLS